MDGSNNDFSVMMDDHDRTHQHGTHQHQHHHHYHHGHDAASTHRHQHHHFDSSTMEAMEAMGTMEAMAHPTSETIDARTGLYRNDNAVDVDVGEVQVPAIENDNENENENEGESPINKRGEKKQQQQQLQQQQQHPKEQQKDDKEKETEAISTMSIEERQIHDSLLQQREEVHAKLQATLVRVHDTTETMLNEIGHFLESTESVMVDYTKCQNSQREEARRLEEVEPDVAGATERYLAQVQGMMMQK